LTGPVARARICTAEFRENSDHGIREHIVKPISLLCLCAVILLQACTARPVSEREFRAVWDDYLQREFEEGFDERQSMSQSENLLRETATIHGIDYEALKRYMAAEQKDKYDKIFMRR